MNFTSDRSSILECSAIKLTGAALDQTFAPAEECSEKFCMRVLMLLTSVCAPPLATVSRTSFNVMLAVVPLKTKTPSRGVDLVTGLGELFLFFIKLISDKYYKV